MQGLSRDVGCYLVVRTFQSGAGDETSPFDRDRCMAGLVQPLIQLLETSDPHLLRGVIVVVNASLDSPSLRGEVIGSDGKTPTMRFLEEKLALSRRGGCVDVVVEKSWGPNAGSAQALNAGWRQIEAKCPWPTDVFISWNPELKIEALHVHRLVAAMERYGLDMCGYFQTGWATRVAYHVPQNSFCGIRISALRQVGGFDVRCDGRDGQKIMTTEQGEVLLAGMEDWHLLLRLLITRGIQNPLAPRVGMLGKASPIACKTTFTDPARQQVFDQKVARQLGVMRQWCRELTPDLNPDDVIDWVIGRIDHQCEV